MRLHTNSWLRGHLESESLCLDVHGTDFEIAEVAEQLAWLGSALQPRNRQNFCVYSPAISFSKIDNQNCFFIMFPQTPDKDIQLPNTQSSDCWKRLFAYMPIVRGFPIPSRPNGMPGLDIPLDIAAHALGADRVVRFKSRLLVKGLSTVLYLTKADLDTGTISWHILDDRRHSRISYADPRIGDGARDGVEGLQPEDLEHAQHIIGWCPELENLTGKWGVLPGVSQDYRKPNKCQDHHAQTTICKAQR